MIDLEEFQTALYSTLNNALDGIKVYDHRPKEPTYPFVSFRLTFNDNSTKTEQGYQALLDISVFSTYQGNKEIYSIMGKVLSNMNDSSLTTQSNQAIVILDNTDILDDDEEIKAAVINYTILLS